MSWSVFQLVLMGIAAIRLTRLVVEDYLLQPFRHWVENKEVEPGGVIPILSFTTLLNCSWCAGMWVSGLVVGLSAAWSGFFWLWGVLALSMIIGWESIVRERLEVD